MNKSAGSEKSRRSNLPAGAAGAGGGTLLVLLANNLPADNRWKPWLVLIAPSVSIGISTLWIWLKHEIEGWLAKRALRAWIIEARQTLDSALRNPLTSEEHKAQLRRELEKLEALLVKTAMNRVGELAISITQ
jgi:hypothetical protein